MIKKLLYLTFIFGTFIGSSQCDVNMMQGPMIADPDGAYDMHLIDGEISLDIIAGYDTLTAFPNALIGQSYETIVGLRVPNDTTFAYDLAGNGEPTLFEDVEIGTISINTVEGMPDGFAWECVPGNCSWTGGQYGCIRIFSDEPVSSDLIGAHQLNFLLDVEATYSVAGFPLPIEVTVDDLLDYYVLVISEEQNNAFIGEVVDARHFSLISTFPNPARDHLTIQYGSQNKDEIDVKIYDILGNVVAHKTHIAKAGLNEFVFNSFNLVSGIYTLSLSNNSKAIMERIIID